MRQFGRDYAAVSERAGVVGEVRLLRSIALAYTRALSARAEFPVLDAQFSRRTICSAGRFYPRRLGGGQP